MRHESWVSNLTTLSAYFMTLSRSHRLMPRIKCWRELTRRGGRGGRSRPLTTGWSRRPTGSAWRRTLWPRPEALTPASSSATPSPTCPTSTATWGTTRSAWRTSSSSSSQVASLSSIIGMQHEHFRELRNLLCVCTSFLGTLGMSLFQCLCP